MATPKQLMIRRAIVKALHAYNIPQNLDVVSDHGEVIIIAADPEQLRAEWINLIDAGILVGIPGYKNVYAKIAPQYKLRLDNGEALRDVAFLYGPQEA